MIDVERSKMTGEEWAAAYCEKHDLDWEKLSPGQRFAVTRAIPCTIRCFRVGVAIDVHPGERCPECGKPVPLQTSWERLPLELAPE